MNIIAADDENPSLVFLVKTIEKAVPSARVYGFRKAEDVLAFAGENGCEIAFLDVEMGWMDGVELAKQLKVLNPKINIIFVTGHPEYMEDAFSIHASGYILKPATKDKIQQEIENLRHPAKQQESGPRIHIQTFGNFEVFLDGKPMRFRYSKTKELLAYLVDRHGAFCTNGEIMGILWENQADALRHGSYLKKLRMDLLSTLREAGCQDVVIKRRGGLAVVLDQIDCDYMDWLRGDVRAINSYKGEYMSQYSWGEITLAGIETFVTR